jgi:hypothetical protein
MNNFATYPHKFRHLQKTVSSASNSAFSRLDTFVMAWIAELACRCKNCGHDRQLASNSAWGGGVARQLLP